MSALHAQTKPDITLNGTITGSQNNSYVEAPFTVPEESYPSQLHFITRKDQHTALDLGLFDPSDSAAGQRQQRPLHHQHNQPHTIYLPGPLPAG